MPLPFAPPPDKSKVYADLKNVKVSDVTSTQIDTLKDSVYAQGVDGAEDELRRLNLLSQAANAASASGPIIGTSQVVSTGTLSSTGSGTILQPDTGQTWEISALAVAPVGGSGTYRVIIFLEDSESGQQVELLDQSETSSNAKNLFTGSRMFVTNRLFLRYNLVTLTGSDTLKVTIAATQIR